MKILNNFLCINNYIFPFAIVAGPFFGDFILSLSAVIFLIILLYKRDFKYINNVFSISFFAWCFYLICLSLLSSNIFLSFESTLFYVRFGFFSLSIWYCLDIQKEFSRYFFISLIIIFLILIFDSYLQYFSGTNLLGRSFDITTADRLSSLFGSEGVLGSYLSRILPLFLALGLIYSKNKYIPLFIFFIFIFIDVIVFITGERTAFFYIILNSIIFILLIKRWKALRMIALVLSISSMFLLSSLNQTLTKRMINDTIDQTNILSSEKKVIFTQVHQEHYISAYKMFIDHPLIGIGPKLFREYCLFPQYTSKWACSTHPHNTYLQLLSETGLIGTFPVLMIFCFIVYMLLKQFYFILVKKKYLYSDYFICLLTCLIITVWPFSPSGNFFGNWLNLIYFLPIGFILHSINNKNICAA